MNFWLMKSEPGEFSIEDLRKRPRQTEPWTGVRNYSARNHLAAMRPGDRVLFHHSSVNPAGIAGLAVVVSEPFPDPTALDSKSKYFDARAAAKGVNPWRAVNLRFVAAFPRLLTLVEIRGIPALKSMVLLRRGRLSVQPVTPEEYGVVAKWGGRL